MTVGELRRFLEDVDPALPVYFETEDGYYREAAGVRCGEIELWDGDDNPILDEDAEYVMRKVLEIYM